MGVAQPALCGRYRHAARAPRRGRLHAVDVPLFRSHRAIVRRAATPRGHGGHHAADWTGGELAAAPETQTHGSDNYARPHVRTVPRRRAYCFWALRAHAEFEAI